MAARRLRAGTWTRRGFLALCPAAAFAAEHGATQSERVRFLDGATEFEVSRLTSPQHRSLLPPPQSRLFVRRGPASLLFSSDATGTLQGCLLDLKSWQQRIVTDAQALDPASLCLTADERSVCYIDGDALRVALLATGKSREAYKFSGETKGAIHVIPDGPLVIVAEEGKRLKGIPLLKGAPRTIVENAEGVRDPMPRPRRASMLYRTNEGKLFLAHLDGSRNIALKPAAGKTGAVRWSPDGRTVLYLYFPDPAAKTSQIRELNPDTGEDRPVAPTSQYAQFSPNGDATVFVGASASIAQPHVLLLLRSVKRELTLCEHKATDAEAVAPLFSPDSQRIFFQSDRHGKPAIYAMAIEKLVEKTEA